MECTENIFLNNFIYDIEKVNKEIQFAEGYHFTRISRSKANTIITQININISELIKKMDNIISKKKKK